MLLVILEPVGFPVQSVWWALRAWLDITLQMSFTQIVRLEVSRPRGESS